MTNYMWFINLYFANAVVTQYSYNNILKNMYVIVNNFLSLNLNNKCQRCVLITIGFWP